MATCDHSPYIHLLLIIRLAGAPKKCEFLHNGMNIVDVLAILPYFVEIAMAHKAEELGPEKNYQNIFFMSNQTVIAEDILEEDEEDFQGILQVFRVFKLARILKLARFLWCILLS